MARPQTTQQDLSNKLNTLESVIVNAEDSAEDARYQQAQIVVRLLDGDGVPKQTQRQIAADWYNGRTGKPYTQPHIKFVADVWRRWGDKFTNRPDWTTAYYTVQKGSEELIEPEQRRSNWSDAHESRAPKSEETAEKLVQNLLKKSTPPEVAETVYRGLHEGREQRYVEPVERERRRKEADAFASDIGAPIKDAFSKLNVVLHLEQALDELKEMGTINRATHDRITSLLEDIRQEAEVKYAMEGIR